MSVSHRKLSKVPTWWPAFHLCSKKDHCEPHEHFGYEKIFQKRTSVTQICNVFKTKQI